MLAILHVGLPFNLVVPEQTEYVLYTYSDGDYQITVYPPSKSDRPATHDAPDHVSVNGKPAFFADVVNVRFYKPDFIRAQESEPDPPYEVLNRAVDSVLRRLKYVTKAFQIHPVSIPTCAWRLRYLHDDETELSYEEGKLRGRGGLPFTFSFIACDPAVWNALHSLPSDFAPPPWHDLLIDSRGTLPHVGTAVVLAASALEVFIAHVLTQLAPHSNVPARLWEWINDRGDWQKEPSVEDQFSTLLEVMCGHSLKERNDLWESFKNLRKARNSFVHEGRAMIGRTPVSATDALQLIARADEIVETVRLWLPDSARWPVISPTVQVEIGKRIVNASNSQAPSSSGPDSAA